MKLYEVIWKEQYLAKLEVKHDVYPDEVEAVLFQNPVVLRAERGHIKGEDLYFAYGQTEEGRYLIVLFVYKGQARALPISARDMTTEERRYYERHRR